MAAGCAAWAMRKTVYLSLGSNLGDREANLRAALAQLAALGQVTAVSAYYETEPLDYLAQPWFLNCAVAMTTELMPRQFLALLQKIEHHMGRKRTVAKGPRVIDLDILLFGSCVVDTPQLTIPHSAMHQRRFVLEPLAEIAPDVRHPVFKRTIRELRDALPHGQQVRRVETNPTQRHGDTEKSS